MRRRKSVSGRHAAARAKGLLVAAGWVSLVLGTASCAKIESRDHIRDGNRSYGDGQYTEAIDHYSKSIEIEPDGVTVFWNRACAAEAQVLKMKDPDEAEKRHEYADMALKDFQTWLDRVDDRTEEDEQLIRNHRLTILDADDRCDELLQHWMDKHQTEPAEEKWYGVIYRQYEKCSQPDKATQWLVKRTKDFPESVRAWHQLATRKFEPLWPDPETQLPYNENVPNNERLKIADEVITLLNKATAIDPKFKDAYAWRKMAYTQKQFARMVVEEPELPEEKIEAIRARQDSMLGWQEQKALCDLEDIRDCPGEDDPPLEEGEQCCPPPPLTPEEQNADVEALKQAEAEIEAAKQEALEADSGNKKRRKRRRK
jgi:tetratricopeptide (TPR) repeat protein